MAVREGHAEVVQLPLQAGADPGQSRYTYNPWDKLLAIAEERGYGEVQVLLVAALREGDAAVAHSQFPHELMGRDNPALIGVFLEITPDVGVLRLRSGHACSN